LNEHVEEDSSCLKLIGIGTGSRKKRGKRFCDYPVATVASGGPNDKRVAKVSVANVMRYGAEANPIELWFSETTNA
jgi:hypothetical protein